MLFDCFNALCPPAFIVRAVYTRWGKTSGKPTRRSLKRPTVYPLPQRVCQDDLTIVEPTFVLLAFELRSRPASQHD